MRSAPILGLDPATLDIDLRDFEFGAGQARQQNCGPA